MPTEYRGRFHGDGRLTNDEDIFKNNRVTEEQRPIYLGMLKNILNGCEIDLDLEIDQEKTDKILGALKRRCEIAFSNGCPWPERAITNFIKSQDKSQKTKTKTLDRVVDLIDESGVVDGRRSILAQILVDNASETLREDMFRFRPWEQLEGQEIQNLPPEMTSSDGPSARGLAGNELYFGVVAPLDDYIFIAGNDLNDRRNRYIKVMKFFKRVGNETKTVDRLVKKTERFLKKNL